MELLYAYLIVGLICALPCCKRTSGAVLLLVIIVWPPPLLVWMIYKIFCKWGHKLFPLPNGDWDSATALPGASASGTPIPASCRGHRDE